MGTLREHRLRSARPRTVGSESPQSLVSVFTASNVRSGFCWAYVHMYKYNIFLSTISFVGVLAMII